MRLRLKKVVAYPLWTLVWIAAGIWAHVEAAREGWRHYRWASAGAWSGYGRGVRFIRQYGKEEAL